MQQTISKAIAFASFICSSEKSQVGSSPFRKEGDMGREGIRKSDYI